MCIGGLMIGCCHGLGRIGDPSEPIEWKFKNRMTSLADSQPELIHKNV